LVAIYDPILAGIVRILNIQNQIVGTGFLISHAPERQYGLIATSTRVIESATSLPIEESLQKTVQVIFHLDPSNTQWEASIQSWSLSSREDVSVLRVEGSLPKRVRALPLSLATALEGRKISLFGYPANAHNFLGEWRYCDTYRSGPKQIKTEIPFIQLDSQLFTDGYSGAPVWDDEHRKVIGLVTQVVNQNQQGNAYAAPIEVLQRVYNDVRATTPSPYHGLTPFSESDAASFFGYDDVINRMTQKLHDESRFLAVLGPVGSGKSSVVRAGLMHKLQHGEVQGYEEWGIFYVCLADNPFQQLEAEGLEEASIHLSKGIHTWSQRHGCQRLVFILDQFEVFLQQCPQDIQQRFVAQLLGVIHERAATVVLVLKDEFYSLLAKHEALMQWVETSLVNVFAPRTREALLNIARKRAKNPGAIQNLALIEQIIDRIIEQNQTNNRSIIGIYELCQTQVTLYQEQAVQLKEDIDTDKLLSLTEVKLDEWAESVFDTLNEQQKAFAQRVFMQVVLPGDETLGIPDTGRKVRIAALCEYESDYEEAYKTVYELAEKRLFITSRDRHTGYEMVTIAQDDLIREWQRLRGWLHEYREFQLWQRSFQLRVSAWLDASMEDSSNSEDHLLEGFALAEAEMWLTKRPADFDQPSQNFIQTSQQRKQQQKSIVSEEAKRQQEEREQRQLAQARELSDRAVAYMQHPSQTQCGIELAVEALSHAHCPEADWALRRWLLLLSHPITSISVDNPSTITFSHYGRYAAIAREDLHVDIVELATGQPRFRFPHTAPVTLMTFDYTTTYFATVSRDRTVSVWKVSEGIRHFSYREAHRPIMVKFSLDGRYLAVVHWDEINTMIKVWEVDPWRHHSHLHENEYVNDIDFNHDNTLLAVVGRNGTIRVWNIASRKGLFVLDAPGSVNLVVFSPGGQYLAIGTEQGVVVLGMESLEPLLNECHKTSVRSLLFSPEGNYVASGSDDGMVRIWDIPSGRRLAQLSHNGSVRAIAFSVDNTYLATTVANQVHIWELGTYHEIARLAHEQPVWKVVFSMDRRYLFTLSDERIIRVWKTIKSREHIAFACQSPVTAVACYVQDNILFLAASCVDNTLWQWQRESYDEQQIVPSISQWQACSLAYSSDGRYLATASAKGSIRLWDVMQEQEIVSFSCEKAVRGVSFCRDNDYLAVIGRDSVIQTWKWRTKSNYATVELDVDHSINDIVLSPDEHYIGVAGNDGSARIWTWRVSGADLLFELSHTYAVLGIRFSPDGQAIATISGDHKVYLWDMCDGSLLSPLEHEDAISVITFSPDSQYIATASKDQRVKIWETVTGRLVSDLPQTAGVQTITFSPDGMYLAAGCNDGGVTVWLWRPEDLIYEAYSYVAPDLREEEWQQSVEDEADPTIYSHAL
jgi:WD40 repeat protein